MMRAVQVDGYGVMRIIGLVSWESGHWVTDRSKRSCLMVKLAGRLARIYGSKSRCDADTRSFNKREKQLQENISISLANWIQCGLTITKT